MFGSGQEWLLKPKLLLILPLQSIYLLLNNKLVDMKLLFYKMVNKFRLLKWQNNTLIMMSRFSTQSSGGLMALDSLISMNIRYYLLKLIQNKKLMNGSFLLE